MNAPFERAALRRLAVVLYLLAGVLFLGTIGELIAVDHDESLVQLIPFALCGLGIVTIAAVWRFPARPVVLLARAIMLVTAAGSGVGLYYHLAGNWEFASEIHRSATTMELIKESLTGGAPLLAPGMLAFGAAIVFAATYAAVAARSLQPAPFRQGYVGQRVETGTRLVR